MNDIELLARQYDELENRNKELRNKNKDLQSQLAHERRRFADMANSLKNEMDVLKRTTLELEDQVTSLLRNRDDQLSQPMDRSVGVDPSCATEVTFLSYDDAHQYQSEIDLFRILRDIWRNKYRELERQLHHGEHALQEEIIQIGQQLPQQQHQPSSLVSSPIKKLVRRVSSLKNRVKHKSSQVNCIENQRHFRTSSGGYSSSIDGTDTTETTAEASMSSSFSFSSLPLTTPPNNRYFVSSMPWNRSDFHSCGLYSGQIDAASKLPDGFGIFRCSCGDDGCYLKGEWTFGELIQRLDSQSRVDTTYDENEVNPSVQCHGPCTCITQDVPDNVHPAVRSTAAEVLIHDVPSRSHSQFSNIRSFHEFHHSDSVSVTEL
ncbi:hypothetical protein ACHAW6_001378 [Cyclotella cf. meneghiniana]